jgi:GT2 family glycosyltransferase
MKTVELSFVIVTWNDRDRLVRCLRSLQAHAPNISHEMILVDNGSTDGTAAAIRETFPDVRLIENISNFGLAKARNQGIAAAQGDFIFFLDSDSELKTTVDNLVDYLKTQPTVAVVGPKVLYANGELQLSCRKFPTIPMIFLRALGFTKTKVVRESLMENSDHTKIQEVDWVIGAAMLVRRKAADDIHFFNERYFYVYDDISFCFELSKKKWHVHYVPTAEVIHHYQRKSAKLGLTNIFMWRHIRGMLRFFVSYYRWRLFTI